MNHSKAMLMEGWFAIVMLIVVGLILIYLELIFVPGTTFLGVIGLILTVIGIYLVYSEHGARAGNYALLGSLVVSIMALVFSFKSNAWSNFSLKLTNSGKVNEGYSSDLEEDMTGVAISDLKPFGRAEFNNKIYEVSSPGYLVDSGSSVKIVKVTPNKITVEIINS